MQNGTLNVNKARLNETTKAILALRGGIAFEMLMDPHEA